MSQENKKSDLIVASFDDMFKADQALISLVKLQSEQLIDLEDAVVVRKDANGRTQVRQTLEVSTGQAAVGGSWWGLLVGLLLGGPIIGLVSGAAFAALAARLTDLGIDNKFIKEVGEEIKPNTSAIFVLAKRSNPEKLAEELRRFDAAILRTNLHPLLEAELKHAIRKERGEVEDDDDTTPEETEGTVTDQ